MKIKLPTIFIILVVSMGCLILSLYYIKDKNTFPKITMVENNSDNIIHYTSNKETVRIVSSKINQLGNKLIISGVILNESHESITAVSLKLTCTSSEGNLKEFEFGVGQRMEKHSVKNRTTNQYENKDYYVYDEITSGDTYKFETSIENDIKLSDCFLEIASWTRYFRTIE
jgi:hypothetical protein